ncbi:uncharacterized protein LOC122045459 isoform X1 [Zingiber officinale]|uniref:uncharacterized protein LOC122045459 isoform X1 n=1 Tax=Zingiber officinale TaxID=94328 RepID=UPI001C4C9A00|nr:uncharacterized protein LOC122045459 isoform X1 [Zingiber officinale]
MEDKEIEFQLGTANPELKYSEDTLLRLEVEVTNDEKINNEFKLGKEVLNDQIPRAEQSCNFDIEELDALLSDGIKQKNNVDINEVFNASQCNELKIPMENIEIEAELAKSAGDAHSVEELYKPIDTQEELESIRAVGLEVEVTNDRL